MDQTGAFLGPLMVALVLHESHQYPNAYAFLAVPAGLAIAALFTAMRFYPDPNRFEETKPARASHGSRLPRAFWIYVAAAGTARGRIRRFSADRVSFPKNFARPESEIPVFYAAAMGVEALAALGFGKLFDRVGTPVLIGGALLSAASSPLAFFGSFYAALAGVALWGAGMGAQQSTLRAKIADLVPSERRGSAYGIFNSVYGVLWFLGSSAIGILYGRSLVAAVGFAVIAQLAAIPLLVFVWEEIALKTVAPLACWSARSPDARIRLETGDFARHSEAIRWRDSSQIESDQSRTAGLPFRLTSN